MGIEKIGKEIGSVKGKGDEGKAFGRDAFADQSARDHELALAVIEGGGAGRGLIAFEGVVVSQANPKEIAALQRCLRVLEVFVVKRLEAPVNASFVDHVERCRKGCGSRKAMKNCRLVLRGPMPSGVLEIP